MKIAIAVLLFSSALLAQEPSRPAAQRGEAQRPAKPPEPEYLQTREGAQLVEAIIANCQNGNAGVDLGCAEMALKRVLGDPNATEASKAAARHLMARVENAKKAHDENPQEAQRRQMQEKFRERLVKARLAHEEADETRERAAARKQVEEGRMTEEQFRQRSEQLAAAREALRKRLQANAPAREPGNRPNAPPRGGGSRN